VVETELELLLEDEEDVVEMELELEDEDELLEEVVETEEVDDEEDEDVVVAGESSSAPISHGVDLVSPSKSTLKGIVASPLRSVPNVLAPASASAR